MSNIRLDNLGKTYPGGLRAVDGLDLTVGDGEFLVLVGPSGCGKSTTLRMIAGLEQVSEGMIRIDDRVVNHVSPRDRDVAMVFQDYAMFPNKTVRGNIAFGLSRRGVARAEIARRVAWAAELLGLQGLLDRKPHALSGGQRQRVALARALVRRPKVFLFDEPLSNLDAKLRADTRAELKRLHRRLAVTTIYVTHDQEEAMTLGDRIAVLRAGRLQQVGAPLEVYHRPANRFVAGFIGTPSMNFIEGRLTEDAAGQLWFESLPLADCLNSRVSENGTVPFVAVRIPIDKNRIRGVNGSGRILECGDSSPPSAERSALPGDNVAPRESGDRSPHSTGAGIPSSLLKMGTGSELTSENPAKDDQHDVPVPLFQQAANGGSPIFAETKIGTVPENVTLGIRPDNLRLRPVSGDGAWSINGTVEVVELLGSMMDMHVKLADGQRLVCRVPAGPIQPDSQTTLYVDPSETHLFAAEASGV